MFQPVVAGTGVVAWQFLQRTYDRQLETFSQSAELKRDIDAFRERIGDIRNAEELVSDRQLLKVALGAFGLEDDLNNRYFIQKMLEEGTTADDSLANRFADTRYRDLSEAFGFGPNEIPKNLFSTFADDIIDRFTAASFEIATGAADQSMRTALYAQRVLPELLAEEGGVDQKWFSIMGQAPLRALFETAMSLPQQFGQIDIDQQLGVFKDRSGSQFGIEDPADFLEPEAMEDLINTYIARAQLGSFSASQSSQNIALTLLSNL